MSSVTPKALRQQLMQPVFLHEMDREGLSIDTELVLKAIRRHVGRSPLMDRHLERWDEDSRTQNFQAARRVVSSDDTTREICILSPMSMLLSANDRIGVPAEFGLKLHTVRRV